MKHLLVVDDDREIRELVAEQLRDAGYAVTTAANGMDMQRAMKGETIDLLILDLSLPDADGLALCRELRAHTQLPVIMLTARANPIDRILGLEMGADDYLPKPFEPRELLARIRSVLRRTENAVNADTGSNVQRATFDGWTVDLVRRQVSDPDGCLIILSGAEFRLLRIFVLQVGRVLSREQLLSQGAGGTADTSDRAVDLQVSRLRHKFGPAGTDLIKTVRNKGYVFSANVLLE